MSRQYGTSSSTHQQPHKRSGRHKCLLETPSHVAVCRCSRITGPVFPLSAAFDWQFLGSGRLNARSFLSPNDGLFLQPHPLLYHPTSMPFAIFNISILCCPKLQVASCTLKLGNDSAEGTRTRSSDADACKNTTLDWNIVMEGSISNICLSLAVIAVIGPLPGGLPEYHATTLSHHPFIGMLQVQPRLGLLLPTFHCLAPAGLRLFPICLR